MISLLGVNYLSSVNYLALRYDETNTSAFLKNFSLSPAFFANRICTSTNLGQGFIYLPCPAHAFSHHHDEVMLTTNKQNP
jgi:hypothetical protein